MHFPVWQVLFLPHVPGKHCPQKPSCGGGISGISASSGQGLYIVRGKREPELWQLCAEFIWTLWGDSLSLLHRACLCAHRYSFLLVSLEESVLWARTSPFFLALGSSLSRCVI